jgi:hypothetical protein
MIPLFFFARLKLATETPLSFARFSISLDGLGPFGASTHTVAVPPGGILLLVDPNTGWTVTAGTADLLKITNASSTGSATYDIELFGEG